MAEQVVLESVELESGATLAPVEVAYADYGPRDAPVVFIHHALTGDAEATDWWDTLVGPGRPVDTDRFRVVCAEPARRLQGTTGPSSIDPATGEPYGLDFPLFTVRDLVTVHRALLRELGIERVHAAVGGSLGGMQALQWSLDHPEEVERAVLVCATARLTAQNIAFSKVAREAILRHDGMAVARMMAHITYLSDESMRLKFDRARRDPAAPMTIESDFEVEHYLDHQARDLPGALRARTPTCTCRASWTTSSRSPSTTARRPRATCSSPSTATGASAPSTRSTSRSS